jgi:hypothetical protein
MPEEEVSSGVTIEEVTALINAAKTEILAQVNTSDTQVKSNVSVVLQQMASALEADSDPVFRSRLSQVRALLASF